MHQISVRALLIVALLALWTPSLWAQADDVESTFDAVIESFNKHDLDEFLKLWHRDAVFYTANYYFPLALGDFDDDDWIQVWADFFNSTEQLSLTPTDMSFRVTGQAAQAWGTMRLLVNPKDGVTRSETVRVSIVFVRDGSSWKILSWHDSRPRDPQGSIARPGGQPSP